MTAIEVVLIALAAAALALAVWDVHRALRRPHR
jgi:hypothetical protein